MSAGRPWRADCVAIYVGLPSCASTFCRKNKCLGTRRHQKACKKTLKFLVDSPRSRAKPLQRIDARCLWVENKVARSTLDHRWSGIPPSIIWRLDQMGIVDGRRMCLNVYVYIPAPAPIKINFEIKEIQCRFGQCSNMVFVILYNICRGVDTILYIIYRSLVVCIYICSCLWLCGVVLLY